MSFAFEIVVGDYVFRIRGTQAHRGGDIVARIAGRERSAPLDDPLNELMAQVVRNGGCVLTWGENGRLVSSETVPFDKRSW